MKHCSVRKTPSRRCSHRHRDKTTESKNVSLQDSIASLYTILLQLQFEIHALLLIPPKSSLPVVCTIMSASSDRDSQPPPKRPRIYRACLPCVSSKTRCQDVTTAGCYRCRTKHLQCSLLEGAIEPGPSTQGLNVTSDGEVDELRFRLAQVEATSRELQARVRQLEERPALTRPHSAHQIPTHSSVVQTVDTPATGGNLTRMLSWTVVAPDFVFDERLLCISDLQTPLDPVAQGLVSKAQMDMSFHM
jgi:hypothetical protein